MRRFARFWGRLSVWVYDPSPGNERIVDYELETPTRVPREEGTIRMNTFKKVDLRQDLTKIEQLSLVICGTADGYTPRAWQREIADLLPNSTYVEIPRGGHLALISHADTFNSIVLDWLAELEDAERLAPPHLDTN